MNLGAAVAWLQTVVSVLVGSCCLFISFSRQQAKPAAKLAAQADQRRPVLRAYG